MGVSGFFGSSVGFLFGSSMEYMDIFDKTFRNMMTFTGKNSYSYPTSIMDRREIVILIIL